MRTILPNWLLPRTTPRFTVSVLHTMDELTFQTFGGSSRGSRHASQSLVPALALVGGLSELGVSNLPLGANMPDPPAAPKLPTSTDVPVREPFDVPVPEPMEVPPPEPQDVPPPQPTDPDVDPRPRPIP
jgi:hypothetical protein